NSAGSCSAQAPLQSVLSQSTATTLCGGNICRLILRINTVARAAKYSSVYGTCAISSAVRSSYSLKGYSRTTSECRRQWTPEMLCSCCTKSRSRSSRNCCSSLPRDEEGGAQNTSSPAPELCASISIARAQSATARLI